MKDQAFRLRELVQKNIRPGERENRPWPRTLAVASGKGGVGKTNMVLNLALALTRMGKQVIVFDADLGLANVDVLLGLVPRYTLYEVVTGQKTLEEIVVVGPLGLRIIPGGSGIQELANLSSVQRERLVSDISGADLRADIMLVDTGAGISNNVLGFLLAADEVIVVLTPEPTSITDAYGLIKVLLQQESRKVIRLVVNRVSGEAEARRTAEKINLVARRFLALQPEFLGFVQEDARVHQAVCNQKPFVLEYPSCHAAGNLQQIALRLVGETRTTTARSRGGGSFLQRLFKFWDG
ncbi:MAG: MinD/ParA family protein [Clostridia bacterium]|nr:MAG: MinD/ParA family protein [Clostridia bacterium]